MANEPNATAISADESPLKTGGTDGFLALMMGPLLAGGLWLGYLMIHHLYG